MTTAPLFHEVALRLKTAKDYDVSGDSARALTAIEDARASMQQLYYELWRKQHVIASDYGCRDSNSVGGGA